MMLDKIKDYIQELKISSKKIWDKIKSFLISISPCGQCEELENESQETYIKFSDAAEILEEATGAFAKFSSEIDQDSFKHSCEYLSASTEYTNPRELYIKQNLLYAISGRINALNLYKFNPNISGNDWVMVGYQGQTSSSHLDIQYENTGLFDWCPELYFTKSELFIKKSELESHIKTQTEKTKEHLEILREMEELESWYKRTGNENCQDSARYKNLKISEDALGKTIVNYVYKDMGVDI